MIELLQEGRRAGYARLTEAITQALHLGAGEASAVRYLLGADALAAASVPPAALTADGSAQATAYFQRPLPSITAYDTLLERRDQAQQEVA